jgi:CBS domain-containing protein
MRLKEIMKTNLSCLTPEDTVQEAATLMREQNVGFIPICDDEKKVQGTITDRDLATRVLADARDPKTKLADCMSTELVYASPDDDLSRAQELMATHRKSRMLVCDREGRIQGVISLSDIAQLSEASNAHHTLQQVSSREARA